jgi:sulfite reductase (NADPH) flavoprotein alpha-component
MSTAPATLRPPLDPERELLLTSLVDGLDAPTLTWISGYAAGVAAERARGAPVAPLARVEEGPRATVLYGSQTGNGRRIAERLARSVEAAGFAVRLVSAADYPPRQLADERLLYLVMSTHGDGDPPDDARALADHLLSRRAPRLEKLAFAVFALGDSSYPRFCAVGRALDERLAELGARRLLPRVDADVDVEPLASPWLDHVLASVRGEAGTPRLASVTPLRPVASVEATREHPVEAEVLANASIVGRGATRDVRHLELLLPEGRLRYEPGDALGVWPENPDSSVARILATLGANTDQPVAFGGRERPLGEWLGREREITRLTRPFLEQHAARSLALRPLLEPANSAALTKLMRELEVADVLAEYPGAWTGEELVTALRPLAPRLYSIASSRRAVGEELHLTVAVLADERHGIARTGAASGYLASRAGEGTRLRAFLEHNPRFRLPADGGRDIVMVGPGTGVAPFRGFLQERVASGARGRQWLFFGARHRESEFLYQAEWLEALRRGELARLDAAFSRDQDAKVYVQQRLREQGAELYRWLEGGAVLYVCGDAERMAPDVHATLIDLVAEHGGLARERAEDYLRQLAADKRYLRDVY